MWEVKIVSIYASLISSAERKLNELTKEGWNITHFAGAGEEDRSLFIWTLQRKREE